MSKQVWKPGTMVSPVPPVMVSCGSLEKPNILTIAWTGIVNTIPGLVDKVLGLIKKKDKDPEEAAQTPNE